MLKNLKQFNLPEIEEKVLEFWKKNDVFKKSLEKTKNNKEFIFYEGPPTANGRPGTHHILTRAFKDIILRYKTMQGFFVSRRAGWDTQGLPVEIEVEKELGLKNKKEIEEYGIAEFNEKAKISVWKYKDEWEKLTERVGLWLDFENAYITYSNEYLEKLWSIFKQIDKKKLLAKGHKVVPWCPRCGTALSSHELAQGYKEVTDNSVYVKFKLKPNQVIGNWMSGDKTYILSWTTTPWTLPGNVALAVGKDIEYQKVKIGEEILIVAKNRAKEVLGDGLVIEETLKGKDLIGLEYEPLFEVKKIKSDKSYKIYDANFVTTTDGTGVVHTAVMYGEDDYNLGKELGLPQHHTVDKQGKFNNDVPVVSGLRVKAQETEERIFNHLKEKNYLLKIEPYKHEYPFCWRCGTHILYYANDSWFISMSKLRNKLIAANEKVNWIPEYLKEGRFGEWLREVKDWAISRERYWGTPLPIWECVKCQERLVAGSLADLNKFDYHKNNFWIGRHGESTSNVGKWLSGDKETDKKSELTENGIAQIEISAQKLKNKGIDIIYSSPFLRTKQTAAVYKRVLKVEVIYDKRLAELDCGMFNGKLTEDFINFFDHPIERFTKRPLNGEHASDVKKRMMDFIKEINRQHVGKNILIISHGDPLWILTSAIKGLTNEAALNQEEENYLMVGTNKELKFNNWPFNKEGELDLHRPYVDEIDLACLKCKSLATRVKEVADVWFDSGAMPFATGEHPDRYPADYICEAIDQTRGWFYTLLAIGVLMGEDSPYKNVISLGHLLDKNGQKMSKSKGNVVNPWDLIGKYGVDVIRWYFYTVNPPAEPKKFDELDLVKTQRKFISLIYNSYLFLDTYSGGKIEPNFKDVKNPLDRWIISRLHQTIEVVTKKLDKYDIGSAAKEIEFLVDDLSRWYIRRSRKRSEALPVLRHILVEVSKLIAPFNPFFAEALYKSLENHESVHLADWPEVDKNLIDKDLIKQMAEVRKIASEALSKRAAVGIKVRQPLQSLKVKSLKFKFSEELLDILKDEINVKEIIFDSSVKEEIELDTKITPELKKEGTLRDLSRLVQGLRQDAKYQALDKIVLRMELPKELMVLVEESYNFKKDLNVQEVVFGRSDKFDVEMETKLDEVKIWLAVKKL